MRPTSAAIQLAPSPLQFQHATPQRSAPLTRACPGHRNPQPAGRAKPWSMTHWWAVAHRSSGVKLAASATGGAAGARGGGGGGGAGRGRGAAVGGGVVGVVVAGRGRVVGGVVGLGAGFTVVEVEVEVDVVVVGR